MTWIVNPDPAIAGQMVTICYDTPGASMPITCLVDLDPSSVPDITQELTEANPCFSFIVPDAATRFLLLDLSKQCDDFAVTVLP